MQRRANAAALILLAAIVLIVGSAGKVKGRDLGQWENVDPARRQWFRDQKLTPETKQRLGVGTDSCCDAGDRFDTRFRMVDDGSKYGAETYEYLTHEGRWKVVPPDIIQRKPTPDGQPVLFIYGGREVCFIIDREGI